MKSEEREDIKIYTVKGEAEGPTLTVFGAVHGNEKCGTQALERIRQSIEQGKIRITKGTLVFAPICNPRAYEQNVRFTERNLNRMMFPKTESEIKHYEDRLDNVLCPLLEQTDYLLDLHSYNAKGDAFVILGGELNPDYISFAKAIGIPRQIYGWHDAIKKNKDVSEPRAGQGTTEYTRLHGGRALTLECGHHHHPRAVDAGFQGVLNALAALGIAEIDDDLQTDVFGGESYSIRVKGVFIKKQDGKFTQDWKNMDPAKKDTVIARYEDGEEVTMPDDGFLILPYEEVTIGGEWFFWGVRDDLI